MLPMLSPTDKCRIALQFARFATQFTFYYILELKLA
jgi:hypothetical protein